MTQYDDSNRGALFRNTKRENERQPEYNGSINVDGVDYWLSAWLKEGKNGKFFSLSVKRKEPRTEESVQRVWASVEKHFPSRPSGIPERPKRGADIRPIDDDPSDLPF